MKQTLTILILFITIATGFAQEPVLQLSEKHLNKVEKTDDPAKKLKRFRKFYSKDSARYARKVRKYWQHKSDSLFETVKGEKYARQLKHVGDSELDSASIVGQLPAGMLPDQVGQLRGLDSAAVKQKGKELAGEHVPDSSQVANQALQKAGLSQYAGELTTFQSDSLSTLPEKYTNKGAEMAEQKVMEREEFGALNEQQQQFEAIQKTPEDYKAQVEAYQNTEKLKKEALEKAKEQTITNFLSHQEELSAVQKKISAMQRKYSSVLNSNDLSTAEKRSSLKGKPIRERLLIGGNFNVNSLKPFSLDFSPQVGYKFNKKFVVGIGGAYRYTFGNDTIASMPAIPSNSYGYKAFSSYDVFKNFFAYGEYERMTKEMHDSATDQKSTKWVSGLLVGVGREFSVHLNVNMTVMVLYNFLHDSENAIYPRPLTVKLGFRLSDLALIKR